MKMRLKLPLHWRFSLITSTILLFAMLSLVTLTLDTVSDAFQESLKSHSGNVNRQIVETYNQQMNAELEFAAKTLQMPLYREDIGFIEDVVGALQRQPRVAKVIVFDPDLKIIYDGELENIGLAVEMSLKSQWAYTLKADLQPWLLQHESEQLFYSPIILNNLYLGGLAVVVDTRFIQEVSHSLAQSTEQSLKIGRQSGYSQANVLMLLWLSVTILVVHFAAKRVVVPLRNLTKHMMKVGLGDLSSVDVLKRKDEIGDLSRTFQEMISQLKITTVSRNQYRDLARKDPLTHLSNRRYFAQQVEEQLKCIDEFGAGSAIMMIDLNHFKQLNESKGHDAGDQVLKCIADRLYSCLRKNDFAARIGGDEFTVYIHEMDGIEDAEKIATRLIDTINKEPIRYQENDFIECSCNIGIALTPTHGRNYETLSAHAEDALGLAKQSGKNRFRIFDEKLLTKRTRIRKIVNAFDDALVNHEFYLLYQPQINLQTGHIDGCEALARWESSVFGPVFPGEFIPIAENSGFITKLGNWVLDESARQLQEWQNQGISHLKMSANLSARQFSDGNLCDIVKNILNKHDISPGDYKLETTESMLMSDVDHAIIQMNKLAAFGIQLSIDDFGTGYSSLSYLKLFPVRQLKIDRSFVNETKDNSADESIIRAIVNLGAALNLEILVEGIETPEQDRLCRDLGCNEAQGYYYGRPMTADEISNHHRLVVGSKKLA